MAQRPQAPRALQPRPPPPAQQQQVPVQPPAAAAQPPNAAVQPPAAAAQPQAAAVQPVPGAVQPQPDIGGARVDKNQNNQELLLRRVEQLEKAHQADEVRDALHQVLDLAKAPSQLNTALLMPALQRLGEKARASGHEDLPQMVLRALGSDIDEKIGAKFAKVAQQGSTASNQFVPQFPVQPLQFIPPQRASGSAATVVPCSGAPGEPAAAMCSTYTVDVCTARRGAIHGITAQCYEEECSVGSGDEALASCAENQDTETERDPMGRLRGRPTSTTGPLPSAEFVATSDKPIQVAANLIRFRDPDSFVAGEIHNQYALWEKIATDHPTHQTVLDWAAAAGYSSIVFMGVALK
ncbi:hypothetical protein Bbelb_343880 [Branchiostoma belcheri]|nr:hypothetical protein Bbelb_343880 [Branchiostoma belcheri]